MRVLTGQNNEDDGQDCETHELDFQAANPLDQPDSEPVARYYKIEEA